MFKSNEEEDKEQEDDDSDSDESENADASEPSTELSEASDEQTQADANETKLENTTIPDSQNVTNATSNAPEPQLIRVPLSHDFYRNDLPELDGQTFVEAQARLDALQVKNIFICCFGYGRHRQRKN